MALGEGDIYEVSTATFDEFVSSSPVVVLEFYAPWCRHCVQFEGVYETIGATLRRSNVNVGKVNSVVNQALSARFALQSIPTVFVIKGSATYRYTGALSHDSIVHYVESIKNNRYMEGSLPLWSSPMGPFGKIKGLMITSGLRLYGMPGELSKKFGLSSTGSMALAVLIVVITLLVLLFSAVYLTL